MSIAVGSLLSLLIGNYVQYMDENQTIVEGYCVKCRAKRQMKDTQEVSMKGKGGVERRALTGVCSVCGTKMFKILGKK